MSLITLAEKGAFLSLLNRNGYVLGFSTDEFNLFTLNSIGIPLCTHYNMSKGRSLAAYINDANETDVVRLLTDLYEYYEMHYQSEIEFDETRDDDISGNTKHYQSLYKKCRTVMTRITINRTPFMTVGENLKAKFSSDYMTAQINTMLEMQNDNPTEAIGKSKEFIESCCKTILEESGKSIDKDWNVSQLVKETMKYLNISTENIQNSIPEAKTIKAILGNLHGIAGNIGELRNAYGSGHGKSASFRGLTVRHARLAVGSSITLVQYLWDTFEWRKQSG